MFPILDEAIESFWKEMHVQNKQDNVVLVVVSEFGRSLSPNSNTGTDHGWGGNYWIQGGKCFLFIIWFLFCNVINILYLQFLLTIQAM